ncbi:MAG: putative xanthine dehydrogenase subunit A [Steroidobacteraceae bacterium]|nr:putative xanthine dehydrogenase subunit A [Steroidobacteraceae bacterium]
MDHELHRLLPFYAGARAAAEPLALAVVLRTAGSTYRKHGAWMLIARDGRFAGLLSGGCLEGDLREHAARVIETGVATIVSYDMRGPDDALWGLGSGCEGAMDVLLTRIGPAGHWQPLAAIDRAMAAGEPCSFGVVAQEHPGGRPLGAIVQDAGDDPGVFRVRVTPPPHVLLLGGGPDAQPVAELVRFLGWRLTVVDHRPVYAIPDRFPEGTHVIGCAADEMAAHCALARIDAAVVMSHHLDADRRYLEALARTTIPYVGLLGPQPRRERLLGELDPLAAAALRPRLRAPIGLDIGANSPSTIALAIVAEIQSALAGHAGGRFSA